MEVVNVKERDLVNECTESNLVATDMIVNQISPNLKHVLTDK